MWENEETGFGGYDSGGITPEELLARLIALQSRLASTMSDVKREEGKIKEKQSKIEQDVNHIGLSVLSIERDMEDMQMDFSSLVLKADSITSTVTALDTRIGEAESVITQTASQISSKVSVSDFNGNTIASLINQTATNITLSALKIDLLGITHVSGNLTLGEAWSPGQGVQRRSITFNQAGSIAYEDGFEYRASTFGHVFYGDVTIESGYDLNLHGVNVRGLNIQVVFG